MGMIDGSRRLRLVFRCLGLASALTMSALGTLGCEPAAMPTLPAAGPNASTVEITTEPVGSDISVDGIPVGKSPQTVVLNPGPHTFKSLKSGYFTADQRVQVPSKAPFAVHLTLIASH